MEVRNLKFSQFQWDFHNLKKLIKHRLTFKEAESCFRDEMLIVKDLKHSINEERYIGIGESQKHRAIFVVFVIRDQKIRVISARRMHLKERLSYEKIKQKNK